MRDAPLAHSFIHKAFEQIQDQSRFDGSILSLCQDQSTRVHIQLLWPNSTQPSDFAFFTLASPFLMSNRCVLDQRWMILAELRLERSNLQVHTVLHHVQQLVVRTPDLQEIQVQEKARDTFVPLHALNQVEHIQSKQFFSLICVHRFRHHGCHWLAGSSVWPQDSCANCHRQTVKTTPTVRPAALAEKVLCQKTSQTIWLNQINFQLPKPNCQTRNGPDQRERLSNKQFKLSGWTWEMSKFARLTARHATARNQKRLSNKQSQLSGWTWYISKFEPNCQTRSGQTSEKDCLTTSQTRNQINKSQLELGHGPYIFIEIKNLDVCLLAFQRKCSCHVHSLDKFLPTLLGVVRQTNSKQQKSFDVRPTFCHSLVVSK